MIQSFNDKNVSMFVYCGHTDIDGSILNTPHDKWIQYTANTQVFYSTDPKGNIYEALTAVKPDVIFINGLYSFPFTLKPLLWKGDARKILSARGMLHPGALSQKALKKKLFIRLFKVLGLHKKCEFHATTAEEAGFIRDTFGKQVKVWEAANFPKTLKAEVARDKKANELSLVTVALISPMKNIKIVLEALQHCKSNINYTIYGPVKDETYWKECQPIIDNMPANVKVQYSGAIEPDKVDEVLRNCHCFIMPSKSENFGHAIYEALSAGKPVITSHFTPWNKLEEYKAGINVDVDTTASVTNAIEKIAMMDDGEYAFWSSGASAYAAMKIDIASIKKDYNAMFGITV